MRRPARRRDFFPRNLRAPVAIKWNQEFGVHILFFICPAWRTTKQNHKATERRAPSDGREARGNRRLIADCKRWWVLFVFISIVLSTGHYDKQIVKIYSNKPSQKYGESQENKEIRCCEEND